jgi:predicted nucleic acid-binding protein
MDDAPFLEVAISGEACLVTGNTRHYPKALRKGVCVMTPDEFRDFFRQSKQEEESKGEEE